MQHFVRAAALSAALLAMAAPSHAQQPAPNPLPPGDGHDVVAVACTQCHGPSAFAQLREGPDAWRNQVYDMILRGAQVQPSELDQVVNYLATNFGPGVNVPQPAGPVTLPDGPGKDIVATNCAVCHGLDRITETKRTPAEWHRIVSRMIFFGAPVSADQAKTIDTYLDAEMAAK
jgi:mono/diheme cytochrome c family protein